jgi:aspartate/methionine/tyrosine aminotransferase
MFSLRLNWNQKPNRLSHLLGRKQREGARILDLTESNPTRAGFVPPHDEILAALADPDAMRYAPAPRGLLHTREAVAAYYRGRGFAVNADHIHLTASTSEGYSFLFKLLANHGDSVLIGQPSYPLFEFLAALEGVELRPYLLEYIHPAGWGLDFDSIRRAITATTRAIILVNPNNPTGSFIKRDELSQLNELCAQHDLALIADEVFGDYAFAADDRRAASLVGNDAALTFVMSGLSKVLALPQMKLGWIVTTGPATLRDEAIGRLDFIADTFLSVGAPVQHAAPRWLPERPQIQEPIRTRIRANLNWLAERTRDSSCRLLTAEGGWYATLELPRYHSEEEWMLRLLEEDDVLVHPGYFFDFPREAFLVLSLLAEDAIFQEAAGRLLARVAREE